MPFTPPKRQPHPHDLLETLWPAAMVDFSGDAEPVRIEADIHDVQVFGSIPKDINGTFYRVLPDPYQPEIYNQKVSTRRTDFV